MNFSSVLFKDFNKANFINLNIENINLENINSAVEENYEDESYKKEREKIDNNSEENEKEKKIKELDLKYKIRWANNFRDSFRVIKHSLIETNNNLEASNFHKLELYAKEIELKNKITKEKNIKDIVEHWQLGIYRNTSEHHTNLIRILNFTIAMIALFGSIIFAFNLAENKIPRFEIPILECYTSTIIIGIFYILSLSLVLYAYTHKHKLSKIAEVSSLSLVLYAYTHKFFRTILTSISYLIFFVMLYASTSSIIPFANLNSEFQNKYLEANISQANKSEILDLVRQINDKIESKNSNFNLEFKDKYLEINITEANKTEIINLASIINPEFNATKNPNLSENLSISELNEYKKFIVENKDDLYKKLDDNDKFKQAIYADSSRDKTIKCISFIYAIILGLCLFSLQKTARRNSVVPS
ncbi:MULTISPECIES: hypothetical protein [unclassified Campylobacter]|nr:MULTISPECIES: hypothetical protein [unclassified Campylobacter]WBR51940.1 hypothetical protein PF026_03610 [Campylobacter sp. CS_NA3]